MLDVAAASERPSVGVGRFLVPLQAFVAPRDHQPVVNPFVNQPFDGALDVAEVKDHSLVVQFSSQYHIGNPAFANQSSSGIPIGEINHSEVVDKEMVHGGSGVVRLHDGGILAKIAGFSSFRGRIINANHSSKDPQFPALVLAAGQASRTGRYRQV